MLYYRAETDNMNKFQITLISLVFSLSFMNSCKNEAQITNNLPDTTITENGIHIVIEIPAGTSKKIEVNKSTGRFEVDQENGADRVIDFLPYPGNYGYIHNTLMDKSKGGDGDALDVLVIAENLETGTHLEVIPIAALLLKDDGEVDTKIIAVPSDRDLQIIDAEDFSTFFMKYNGAFQIIEKWFLNYKGVGQMELINWEDEKKAMAEIIRWQVEKEK